MIAKDILGLKNYSDMIISKKWSMPNSETFSIKPIRELIDRYKKDGMVIVDPFARNSDIGTITNDLDPDTRAMYHKGRHGLLVSS